MTSKIYVPSYPLNLFIDYFFYYAGFNPEHNVDRFLPDANIHLIFDLTDEPKYIYDNNTLAQIQTCKDYWFSGFRTEPITIPSGKKSEMLIVYFKKGKAATFLNCPLNNLTDVVVDADLIFNNIRNIRENLLNIPLIENKFKYLEKKFLYIFIDKLVENPYIDFMINYIMRFPSIDNLKNLYHKVGYSQKHSIKIFKENVGVTPKEFLKVIRFQKAISEIEKTRNINWSRLALDCGFYDQSHFIADFKTFSGFTPLQYMAKKGESINYVPIG